MTDFDGRKRVVIGAVSPEIDAGDFAVKRVVGETLVVEADIFADGHDDISAALLFRADSETEWREAPMSPLGNDRWRGEFKVEQMGVHYYTLQGWVDHFLTWQKDLRKKYEAGTEVGQELLIGSDLIERAALNAAGEDAKKLTAFAQAIREEKERDVVRAFSIATSEELSAVMEKYPDRKSAGTYPRELPLVVDRKKALFSAWYEIFPRSCGLEQRGHGTFSECERLLPVIAHMGFDVIYFPPVHPIGSTNRKGKDNTATAGPEDPGSPWAIGSHEGGHKAIHPALGTMEDFERFVRLAGERNMEVSIDLAFQCSPDHPYVKEHPEWFRWRPDGTIQFAENPPKKYEDIVPFDFETEDWENLWQELKEVVLFWVEKGIRIFRVDNPHTKPFAFWQWLIREVKKAHPDVIFLSEAFTRPKVMYRLAKIGFTQSYTYFTWRNSKREIAGYLMELTDSEVREYFRPNFWPNTPDILHEYLQYGGRPAFLIRLILAATLSSNYGIYGPVYEQAVSEAFPGREEYSGSEKYEIKHWEWGKPESLRDFVTAVNRIRRENPALQTTNNLTFYEADNENVIFYGKMDADMTNIVLIVVNLDPFHKQACRIQVPLKTMGIEPGRPYLVHEVLSEDKYIWQEEWNSVELDPGFLPARIFRVRRRLRREQDFDYFM
ncbi:MAG: alpha-1,4-glucan--maltose-1-phosphate maltosyltransferase [Candidatus Sulfobium sp.]